MSSTEQRKPAGASSGSVDLSGFTDLPNTSSMDIIDAMVAEHERILQEADHLQRMCLALMTDGTFDADEFHGVIRFVRAYADAAHHRKEEDILYDYMLAHLGKVAENLVQHGMLVEHNLGRMDMANLEAAVNAYAEKGDSLSKLEILSWAMEYVHLIRRHVDKENAVVYPFARRSLSAEVIEALTEQARSYVPHAA